jgi:EAL domain-containing protein (putative c-di-GMP-specific phosphodiesterase class I)
LQAPIPLGDRTFAVDAAIGAALYPDHGTDQQTLVRNGKLAASVAREEMERVALYNSAQGASEEHVVELETRLRHALEQGALAVKFAPQLDLATGRLAGFECVLAWTDEELGEVSPARAQVAAEAAGLSRELTWWLYNNALRLAGELAQAGIDLPLGLTATASVLAQTDFAEFIDRALDTWKVDPARVLIEIDETALAGDVEPLKTTLAQLKARGVRLAIGGFGTTSFSLANLSQLPLDEAKIGAAFAADMLQTPVHAKIIRSLVHLAQDLGLGIMAEGVDDAATAEALAKLGCTRIQGAHVGCALSAPELLNCGITANGPLTLPLQPRS